MKKICLVLSFLFSVGLIAQKTYLHCGKVFDSKSGKIKKELTIVVEGEKIKEVLKGYTTPEMGAVVVNLKDKTVYPGFIDMHVHIEGESSPSRYLDRYRLNDSDVAFDAAQFASRTLQAGFTAVREHWLKLSHNIPGEVEIKLFNENFSGRAMGIDLNGSLLVTLPDGTIRNVSAGDVFFGSEEDKD